MKEELQDGILAGLEVPALAKRQEVLEVTELMMLRFQLSDRVDRIRMTLVKGNSG